MSFIGNIYQRTVLINGRKRKQHKVRLEYSDKNYLRFSSLDSKEVYFIDNDKLNTLNEFEVSGEKRKVHYLNIN